MADTEIINSIIAGIYAQPSRAVVVIALEVDAELVEATPVDTGFAESQWVMSKGSPINGVVGSPDVVSRSAQEAGRAHVVGYKLQDGQVWNVNNAEYIEILDGGSSEQAPSGFVRIAINKGFQQAVAKLESEKR